MFHGLRFQIHKHHLGDVAYTLQVEIACNPVHRFTDPFFHAWFGYIEHGNARSLCLLLWNQIISSTQECSDPRDKVYALLGLANILGKYGISANYAEPARDLFIKVTRATMQELGLRVLNLCGLTDKMERWT
jgi:hypothetical protein